MVLSSCGPKPGEQSKPAGPAKLPIPHSLSVEAANGAATLLWHIDRDEATPIAGYYIYLAELLPETDTAAWNNGNPRPLNEFPFPGDTDGDTNRETFPILELINGRSYIAMVRTVGPGGHQLSAASNIAAFTVVGRGEFVIGSDHLADNGGFNFELGVSTPGRNPRSDLYIYSTSTRVGLSSPNRLGAGFRKSSFVLMDSSAEPWETIAITAGDRVIVNTRYGRAELIVEELIGTYPDISARISYVFHPEPR